MKKNTAVTRRTFLETLFTASIASMALPSTLLGTITPQLKQQGTTLSGAYLVKLSEYPVLHNILGSVRLIVQDSSSSFFVIVTRTGEDEFKAVNGWCPHNGFRVRKANSEGILICEAHFSEFEPDGTFIWGPANGQNLLSYPATYDGDDTVSIEIPNLPSSVTANDNEAAFVRLHSTGPLATTAVVEFGIERPAHVTLALFALDGTNTLQLADAPYEAGTHRIPFDFNHLPNGLYLFRLKTSTGYVETGKFVVAR